MKNDTDASQAALLTTTAQQMYVGIKVFLLSDEKLSCPLPSWGFSPLSMQYGIHPTRCVHPLPNHHQLLALKALSPEPLHLGSRSSPCQIQGPESWHRRKGIMSQRDMAAPASHQPLTTSSLKHARYSVFTGIIYWLSKDLHRRTWKPWRLLLCGSKDKVILVTTS